MRLTGAPFINTWPIFNCVYAAAYFIYMSVHMRHQPTADGEECVGLLSLHCGHTFQSAETSPANVHPTLHLRLPKHGADQCHGDDILLLLGGIHLLGAPKGGRSYIVDKGLAGSGSFS